MNANTTPPGQAKHGGHGDPAHDADIAHDALALSRRIEADGIAPSGEAIAEILIRHAALYRDLLAPFDAGASVAVPESVQLSLQG